jgi:hypothetical protein
MNWKYVKALKSEKAITEFEKNYGIEFPDSFKETVGKFNGGRPERDIYDTDKTKGRTIKSLLSFNKDDKETIWKIAEWSADELGEKYIAFAIDHFGNLICFSKSDKSIIFMDHETLKTEIIANEFANFIDKLYSIE